MKQIALLEYTFMLDPSETYSNLFQFENDLSKFFDERGIEAQLIKPIEGSVGKRIYLLTKKPDITVSEPVKGPSKINTNDEVRPRSGKSPKEQFKNIMKGVK